jgi:hypothetical protein
MAGTLRRRRVAFNVALTAAICLWATPAAVAGTVTVGSQFPGGARSSYLGDTSSGTTIANVALGEPGSNPTSPVTGTIVSWRLGTLGPGQYALRVLRPGDGGRYKGVGTALQSVTAGGDHSFAANLPIQAGDLIAVNIPSNPTASPTMGGLVGVSVTGSEWDRRAPPIVDNSSTGFLAASPGSEMLFNAVVSYQETGPPPSSSSATPHRRCKRRHKKHKKHKRSARAAKKKCTKKRGKKKRRSA